MKLEYSDAFDNRKSSWLACLVNDASSNEYFHVSKDDISCLVGEI